MWIHWLCKLQSFVYFYWYSCKMWFNDIKKKKAWPLTTFFWFRPMEVPDQLHQWSRKCFPRFLRKQSWRSRPQFCPNTRMKRCSQILENIWAWRFRFKLARICTGFLLWVSSEKQQKHHHSSPMTCRVEGTSPLTIGSVVPTLFSSVLNKRLSKPRPIHARQKGFENLLLGGAALWTCTFGCYLHWSAQSGFTQFPIDISWWLWKQGT